MKFRQKSLGSLQGLAGSITLSFKETLVLYSGNLVSYVRVCRLCSQPLTFQNNWKPFLDSLRMMILISWALLSMLLPNCNLMSLAFCWCCLTLSTNNSLCDWQVRGLPFSSHRTNRDIFTAPSIRRGVSVLYFKFAVGSAAIKRENSSRQHCLRTLCEWWSIKISSLNAARLLLRCSGVGSWAQKSCCGGHAGSDVPVAMTPASAGWLGFPNILHRQQQ